MGAVMSIECESCGCKWNGLRVGDGKHMIAICKKCKNFVNPTKAKCSRFLCRRKLDTSDFIKAGKLPMRGPMHDDDGELMQCPKCSAKSLVTNTQKHFRMSP